MYNIYFKNSDKVTLRYLVIFVQIIIQHTLKYLLIQRSASEYEYVF